MHKLIVVDLVVTGNGICKLPRSTKYNQGLLARTYALWMGRTQKSYGF